MIQRVRVVRVVRGKSCILGENRVSSTLGVLHTVQKPTLKTAPEISAEDSKQILLENIRKNEIAAESAFPDEQWLPANSIDVGHEGADFEIPSNVENIKIAKSRITPKKGCRTISDNDARTLAKEIRQAKVLADMGASVFILPKMRAANGSFIPGPDALVNGALYEFKTITGGIDKIERRFRQSRDQGQNVFLRIMNPGILRSDVIRKMYNVINDPKYTGGFKGNLIFSVQTENSDSLYYIRIKDLKK